MNNNGALIDRGRLTDFFLQGCVPEDSWRIGVEYEVFAVDPATLHPLPYSGIKSVSRLLQQLIPFGWKPVTENEHLIGLEKQGARVSLEPGCQIEYSSAPTNSAAACCREIVGFVLLLKEAAASLGCAVLPTGYHPLCTPEDIPWAPKERYRIMSTYFKEKGGPLAHDMMKMTCSVQICLDYSDEQDFSQKFALAACLVPVLQAVCSNSPLVKAALSGYMTYRGFCWEHTDYDRCGIIEDAVKGRYSFSDYVTYLLEMPMILKQEPSGPVAMNGLPFKKLLGLQQATAELWQNHMTFVFPEVRLRSYLELRMCDSLPLNLLPSLPALLRGLLYDREARNNLHLFFRDYTVSDVLEAYQAVHIMGLKAEFKGRPILETARDILIVAEQGLKNLAGPLQKCCDDQILLEPLKEQLWEKACSPGEELVKLWKKTDKNLMKLKKHILL